MKITFYGATRTVTGSMFLIEHNEKRILVECGLYQGKRSVSEEINKNFPFKAAEIDMLIVSHAHIDHSGNIPNLVKQGFNGVIHATHATCDLMNVMLRDSGHIHEKDIEYLNKKLAKRGEPLKEALYTAKDAEDSVQYFRPVNYYSSVEIDNELKFTFVEAGHILGSAQVIFEYKDKTILFTGDLGRDHLPIIKDPDTVENVDVLITETTYGDRVHKNIENSEDELRDIILRTVQRNGRIIVPAFSVGRTQEILYDIFQLENKDSIPKIEIFVDSPLSSKVTGIFKNHPECYDKETMEIFNQNKNVFNFDRLKFTENVQESKALNGKTNSHIIISASGMCEAGRILHHLKNNISNANNSIIITGFMAQHTLGRRLLENRETVKIFGEEYNINAEVYSMTEYSAHADKNDLIEHIKECEPKRIFLVHGEASQQDAFKKTLYEDGYKDVEIPERGDSFVI